MTFALRNDLAIAAPVDRVWEVITDLASYPEWNPFVVAARSSLVVGEPISMRVRVFPGFAQPQRETITRCVPRQRLCYGVEGIPGGALRSERCHELRAAGPAHTEYRSTFELTGWLAPLVRSLLGARLERGFRENTRALGERAESLHRGADAVPRSGETTCS